MNMSVEESSGLIFLLKILYIANWRLKKGGIAGMFLVKLRDKTEPMIDKSTTCVINVLSTFPTDITWFHCFLGDTVLITLSRPLLFL